jgi:hypothetical protein
MAKAALYRDFEVHRGRLKASFRPARRPHATAGLAVAAAAMVAFDMLFLIGAYLHAVSAMLFH